MKNTIQIGKHKIKLAPRFKDFSNEELLNMPVQIVQTVENHMIVTVIDGIENCGFYNFSKFHGAMWGVVDGKPALRFEDFESYRRLSQ